MMKRGRLSLAITAILVTALGLGLAFGRCGAASAASASPGGPAIRFSEGTVVINCQGHPQVRPASFTLACADGNDWLGGLTWTSWTPRLASGFGTEYVNDCVAYCAVGKVRRSPVLVILWGNAALRGHPGTQRYTKITLLYPGPRPVNPGYATDAGSVTVTTSLPGRVA
jgi:hypothetical protein